MKIQELQAEMREAHGSRLARRLRFEGKVPCVLYGHGETVVNLALATGAVAEMLESGQQLVTLNLGGRPERAIVKEIQYDTWGREILHVDFNRVALDEIVNVAIEVIAHGTPKAILAGAVLEQPLRRIQVACTADAIPESIRVEVAELGVNEKIHVRELKLPPGVKVLDEPEAIVFVVKETREEVVVAAPVAEAGAAEPEIIGRVAKEEGEEAESGEKEKGKDKDKEKEKS